MLGTHAAPDRRPTASAVEPLTCAVCAGGEQHGYWHRTTVRRDDGSEHVGTVCGACIDRMARSKAGG